jgi:indolepyruvate ferredoxin oxidoreductase beta subunit
MSANNGKVTNVLIVGVGGQGALLVSTIIAEAAIRAGFDVKTNEVHGMAQRGGSVLAQVRFGAKVHSPLVWEGTADVIISLEEIEALRYAQFLREGGLAVVSKQHIIPVTVSSGKATYPADADERLARAFPQLALIDALGIAHGAGSAKAANVVALGAAAKELDRLAPEIATHWNAAIETCVPAKHLELNRKAFAAGGDNKK